LGKKFGEECFSSVNLAFFFFFWGRNGQVFNITKVKNTLEILKWKSAGYEKHPFNRLVESMYVLHLDPKSKVLTESQQKVG
jgi:hypothetical protein